MLSTNFGELVSVVVLVAAYVAVVRLLDLNEREPLWTVALVFLLGALAAGVARVTVGSATLELTILNGAIAREIAKVVALGIGLWILAEVHDLRGWVLVGDLIDGLIYGATVGLGFAAGAIVIRSLLENGAVVGAISGTPLEHLVRAAPRGLGEGLSGAMVGAGFGAALQMRATSSRVLACAVALLAAIGVDAGQHALAYGNALGGSSAVMREWMAIALPFVCIAAMWIYALAWERRALVTELVEEQKEGVLGAADVALLRSSTTRHLTYLGVLARGRIRHARALAVLHNRQVALALARGRSAKDVDTLRGDVRAAKRRLDAAGAVVTIVAAGVFAATHTHAQTRGPAGVQVPAEVASVVAQAVIDINQFWSRTFAEYQPPADVVAIKAPTTTDCGEFPEPNARYCGSTNKIEWDVSLVQRSVAIGQFAAFAVIAHEWGHLIQRERGFWNSNLGLISIQKELQADCFAGTYAADVSRRGMLSQVGADHAFLELSRIGDPLTAPWNDPDAHGTAGQRLDAFGYGLQKIADCGSGAFFDFLKLHGIDTSRVPQKPTPPSGALTKLLPQTVKSFTLGSVERWDFSGATDALLASYTTAGGVQQQLGVAAFASAAGPERVLAASLDNIQKKGYTSKKHGSIMSDGKEAGQYYLLEGSDEVVYWTNGNVFWFTEGQRDVTWGFFDDMFPDLPPNTAARLTWTVTNSCVDNIFIKFFDRGAAGGVLGAPSSWIWPGPDSHWTIATGETRTFNLKCNANRIICYGARHEKDTGSYWGIDLNGKDECTDCCQPCEATATPATEDLTCTKK